MNFSAIGYVANKGERPIMIGPSPNRSITHHELS